MEETLWKFARKNRDLRELRQDIAGIWQDDAARDINSRYLNPHESDAEEVLEALQKQYTYITEAAKFRSLAREEERSAADFTDKMTRSLHATEKEMALVFSSHEETLRLHGKAQDLIPKIDQLIQSANSSCQGALDRDEYNRSYS